MANQSRKVKVILNPVERQANTMEWYMVSSVTDKLKLYKQETCWYALALDR